VERRRGGAGTAQAKEETAHSLRAREVEELTTLGTFACSPQKRTKMMVHLDRLAPYQRPAPNEWP
jgi:hypothetical protein